MYDHCDNLVNCLVCTGGLMGKAFIVSLETRAHRVKDYFFDLSDKITFRKEFVNHAWERYGNVSEYTCDKIILGNKVPVDVDEIIDFIIDGIPDQNLRDLRDL